MEAVPSLTAICVNYNGAQVLPRLLECLRANRPAPRILVVDNASQDGSADRLGRDVQVLKLRRNRGYAAALNAGLRHCLQQADKPDYLLLLNNDLEFASDVLQQWMQCALSQDAWVSGPLVADLRRPSRLDAAWGRVTFSHVLAKFEGRGAESERYRDSRPVQLLLGCALLVKRETFEQVGLFDERFFMYHEEVDFLYRCSREGLKTVFCPQAQVLHHGAYSTRRAPLKKVYWVRRNTLYFMIKHRPGGLAWAYWAATLTGSLAFNLLTLRPGRLKAIIKGVRDGLRGRGRVSRQEGEEEA